MGYDDDGSPGSWYGGKVQFRATLWNDGPKANEILRVRLEKPTLGPSNQLTRRFGSKAFFRVKITKGASGVCPNRLLDFFKRPFILCGAVFRAVYSKDDNVFFFKTNEGWDGAAQQVRETSDNTAGMSFLQFINWHNPIETNKNQVAYPDSSTGKKKN